MLRSTIFQNQNVINFNTPTLISYQQILADTYLTYPLFSPSAL